MPSPVRLLSCSVAAFALSAMLQPAGAGDSSLLSSTKLKGSFWGIADTGRATVAISIGGTAAAYQNGKKWRVNKVNGASLLLSVATAADGAVIAAGGDKFTSKGGSVFRSTDDGQTFERVARAPSPLYEVKFTAPDIGHALGVNGTILTTTDAGKTWNRIQSGTKTKLWAAHFVNEKTGVIGGGDTPWQNQDRSSGEIRRTTDGGKNWKTVFSGEKRISDFAFIDKQTGYAAGVGGTILRTDDGGATWVRLPRAPLRAIVNAIEFVDEDCGLAVGSGGTAYVTTDGAQTWPHKIVVTKGSFLEDLTPKPNRRGVYWTVAGDGTIASLDISDFCGN